MKEVTFAQIRQGFSAKPTDAVRPPIKEADPPKGECPLCSCDMPAETQVPPPCPPSDDCAASIKTKPNGSSDENAPSIMLVLLGGIVMGAVFCVLCLGHGDGRAPRREETSRPLGDTLRLSGVLGQSSPLQSPLNQRQLGGYPYSPLSPQPAARS